MQDYTPATSRSIQPVPPRPQILSADSGPRITLPGPTLPPELSRLQDANVVTVIGEQTAQRTKEAIPPSKGKGAPGWLVSGIVMLVLLAVGLAAVFYLMPHTVADAKPAPTPAEAATVPAPAATGSSPLAKFIEVTGFRIVVDANKKSEVQYLIVNHSDADISDANVFITLRGTKAGQAPVCRFSFKIPSLGPFESKEMSSPIEKSTRNFAPPEWQDLRADVQISQ
jgi:FlaG/FlaF family flagellin (archaellin)